MATDETRTHVMTLDEFKAWFVSEIDWSPPEISEESDLFEDLGMDSVGAVYLMAAIEDAVGGDVSCRSSSCCRSRRCETPISSTVRWPICPTKA